jgi:ABC-2 type transport system ATP-binding protein
LLTTHDMHEADELCREIAVVDRGLIVAQGTPDELKARVVEVRRVQVTTVGSLDGRAAALGKGLADLRGVRGVDREPCADGGIQWTLYCADTAVAVDEALALLRTQGVAVTGLRVVEPTLEDAFLSIAGRTFE